MVMAGIPTGDAGYLSTHAYFDTIDFDPISIGLNRRLFMDRACVDNEETS
jgi:hypothetical protein